MKVVLGEPVLRLTELQNPVALTGLFECELPAHDTITFFVVDSTQGAMTSSLTPTDALSIVQK
jgi:hypothetical protein